MKQDIFQERHEPEWQALEQWLKQRTRPRVQERSRDAEGVFGDLEFPGAYRRVCQHLALAQRRGYSVVLIDRLQDLVHRGHLVLYRPRSPRLQAVVQFFGAEFPRLVRSQWRAMWLSAALMFLPMLTIMALLQYRPELVHSIMPAEQIAKLEAMYDPADSDARLGRESGSDVQMFGVYIMNNISIGFRTFASGLIFCVGSIFSLVFNGVFFGAAFGHLIAIGYGEPLWRFVVGHSAPELLAIVISGGAGMQLGFALIAPGRRSRGRALVEAGILGAKLVFGVFVLLLFAAFVEAFWSSIGWMPNLVKLGVGAALWLAILLWLWRGGRGAAHAG
ncbi:putative membrane protein SpoIIM required for sporulation [Tahibacter aquaticus]|uniref:Putative membrane protein SpoIIM required for sporulation n=1 Tax=Tahibacter aquaticus TaxID=520092 RepID=A0A4R6YIG5_9GAMM|nr:stage II sporulation protein M [Tahibacter aquaticus]TDR36664.1 putative membrane protein SpoIIM required for sporulation [Tahibacter aquaticus]